MVTKLMITIALGAAPGRQGDEKTKQGAEKVEDKTRP
jgi:hypothetical protein